MDSDAHRRLTGVANDLILRNLRRLAELGTVEIRVRVPVIPGRNDTRQNMVALAEFVASLPAVTRVEMLAYDPYGTVKYARCGRASALADLAPPARSQLEELAAIVRTRGVECTIG